MHVKLAKSCLSILALAFSGAIADEPSALGAMSTSLYRFDLPISHNSNGNLNMKVWNIRCGELGLSTNDEALARIDWAEQCRYISKEKWWPIYSSHIDPFTWQAIPRDHLAYPIFSQGAEYKLWVPNNSSCEMPDDVVFLNICMSNQSSKNNE